MIGKMAVASIGTGLVLEVMEPIWQTKPATLATSDWSRAELGGACPPQSTK